MSKLNYTITFLSYWAVGSGKGGGLGSDSLVLKEEKLPIIPGKTLKGLILEAYREVDSNSAVALFGHEKRDESKDEVNEVGSLHFGSARLPHDLRIALLANPSIAKELFHSRTSTELDSQKQAVENSLRKMQVCVPISLKAEVEGDFQGKEDNFKKALKGLRRLGEKRYRGLGRCTVSEIEIIKTETNHV